MDLTSLSIREAHDKLASGEITVRALVDAYLAVVLAKNTDINAYLEVYGDIDQQVDRAQQRFVDGTATILTGIPVALKDNMLRRGFVASSSSRSLEEYVASYDSTVVKKLSDAGAVFIGRTNMDEFAMGSSTENSAFGVTKNPLDTSRVPGGSSGGSAAAVAMHGAFVGLGSDTGGSIRQPAAFCGLVGLKPTYGTVSRHGLMAMSSSLDQIGPLARSVDDAEILFDAIVGYDANEATSIPDDERIAPKKETMKIGVPRAWVESEGVAPDILENFKASLALLEKAGYEIVDIDLPYAKHSLAVYYILQPAEVSSNLARFDGIRYGTRATGDTLLDVYTKSRGEGFGAEVRRRILLGTYTLSHGYYDAYYGKATEVTTLIRRELDAVFESVDAIATPTSPFLPFRIGERANDPLAMYISDLFTVPANIAGNPGISVPSGKNKDGLPYSMQFMGPNFSESRLFTLGKIVTGE